MSRILLCAGASVAIYKACDLASKLTQAGDSVRTVLTPAAAKLVSPQLFAAVTGQSAQASEFGDERRGAMDHIELAEWAELLLVAPASADLVGRLANGLADDLVATVALAFAHGRPRLVCPAMNPKMLEHPAVARNLARLREDGWEVLEPEAGHMACGDEGKGRLPEPATIQVRVRELLRK
jgi:phosphopantothenoylcysteine decarboxylase/phosphopantothenate--cysteine ligase